MATLTNWYDTASTGDYLPATAHNQMVEDLNCQGGISGSYVGHSGNVANKILDLYSHSSNTGIHLTAVQLTDLTDGGTTSLHTHATATASGQNYAYDYTIYRLADTYYAQQGENGLVVYSDSKFTDLINQCTESLLNSGGRILVRQGEYEFSGTAYIYDDTEFRGMGRSTKIGFRNAPDGATYTSSELRASGSRIYIGDFWGSGAGRIRVRYGRDLNTVLHSFEDITLNNIYLSGMNLGENTSHCHGIIVLDPSHSGSLYNVRITNCHVRSGTTLGGIQLLGQRNVDDNTFGSERMKIKDVWIDKCTVKKMGLGPNRCNTWPIGFGVVEGANVENCFVTNCVAEDIWESGFHCEAPAANNYKRGYNINYINCVAKNTGKYKKNQVTVGAHSDDGVKYGSGFRMYSGCTAINCRSYNPGINCFYMMGGGTLINCFGDGSGSMTNTTDGSGNCEYCVYLISSTSRGNCGKATIRDSTFMNCNKDGIYNYRVPHTRVINNRFYNVGMSGLSHHDGISFTTVTDDSVIKDNYFHLDTAIGNQYCIRSQSPATIQGNLIDYCVSNAICLTDTYIDGPSYITDNIIKDAQYGKGIWMSNYSPRSVISRNIIHDVASNLPGIYFRSRHSIVSDNVVVGDHTYGIQEYGATSYFNDIHNNTVSGGSASHEIAVVGEGSRARNNIGNDDDMRWDSLSDVDANQYAGEIVRISGETNEHTSVHISVRQSDNTWGWLKLGDST